MTEGGPKLLPLFIPALVVLLKKAEKDAGRALTKDEVIKIRDDATVMMVPISEMPKFVRERGYHDLYEPEVWDEWEQYRNDKLDLSLKNAEGPSNGE